MACDLIFILEPRKLPEISHKLYVVEISKREAGGSTFLAST